MEDARRAGADFDSAWHVSLSAARFPGDSETRLWYRAALDETREHWEDAYEGRPPRCRGAAGLAYLAAALDAEPLFGAPEPPAEDGFEVFPVTADGVLRWALLTDPPPPPGTPSSPTSRTSGGGGSSPTRTPPPSRTPYPELADLP
jgi:hypothetical protein